jgi:hypothetical protein
VISDTVIFRHHTLTLPAITTEDRIIHCLCALTTAIQADRTPTKTDDQLLAIESLRAIFSTLQHPQDAAAPRVETPLPLSSTPSATPPRVQSLPRVHIEPTTPFAPPLIAPLHIRPPSDDSPIALRTRARCTALSASTIRRVTSNLPALHTNSSTYRAVSNYSYTRGICRI